MKLMIEDTKDEIDIIEDDGTPEGKITTVMGVNKINDPMLLEEMINYRGKTSASKGVHDGNYDRIIREGCAQTLARHYNIAYPMAESKPKQRTLEELFSQKTQVKTMFGTINIQNQSPFKENSSSRRSTWMRGII